jgi:organic hydroperoxide reductase OsmC/OhrA
LTPEAHEYRSRLEWSGSTGEGYERYTREHLVTAPPAHQTLRLSSDPAFRGNPELLDPEELLLIAASSCQLLEFLAICARARIDVVSYADDAEAVMLTDDEPMRITRITLRPRIVVAGGANEERLRRYVNLAHEHCYVANSLHSEIEVEPEIDIRSD